MEEVENKPKRVWHPGRPKGATNRKTRHFIDTLVANGYDPALTLLELQREAYENYKEGGEKSAGYFKNACDLASDIASYVFAKPKAIEITTTNPLEGMTAAEKLEAMKQAVALLEEEVEKDVKQIEVKE